MARACGIRLGPRNLDVVVLEGSAKKPKVAFTLSQEIEPGDDPAALLKQAAKEHKIPGDAVELAMPGGNAAYRVLTLPFDDAAKIEQVIKFEVESDLPQWNIDDVVVDFQVLDSTPGVSSQLLVTAVPKDPLAEAIELCGRAGLEPLEAQLDGSGLVNAAHFAGVLEPDAAQVLVMVGEHSTSIVVVDDGQVKAMRALQVGGQVKGVPAAPKEAEADEDAEGETREAGPDDDGAIADAASEAEAAERMAGFRKRLERELGRTLVGANTEHDVEAVYMAGEPIPGLSETIADVPVRRLELFPREDEDGVEWREDEVPAVAFGAALRRLGGGILEPTLRREELRYAGTFERLEEPLAGLVMLLLFGLFFDIMITNKRLGWRDQKYLQLPEWTPELIREKLEPNGPVPGDLAIWLEASNSYLFSGDRLPDAPDDIRKYANDAAAGLDTQRTKYEQLLQIRSRLERKRNELLADLGHDNEVTPPPSAFKAATLVLGVLDQLGKDGVGMFALESLTSTTRLNTREGEFVIVELDMTFFGDTTEATRHAYEFLNTLREKPWIAEDGVEEPSTDPLDDGGGISISNWKISVDTRQMDLG